MRNEPCHSSMLSPSGGLDSLAHRLCSSSDTSARSPVCLQGSGLRLTSVESVKCVALEQIREQSGQKSRCKHNNGAFLKVIYKMEC